MAITVESNLLSNRPIAPAAIDDRGCNRRPSRLLIFMNPGRVSRHYVEGIRRAAVQLGIHSLACELEPIWARGQAGKAEITRAMIEVARRERIGAVIGYVYNGSVDFQFSVDENGRARSLWEALGIPHLMVWTDHPQWASEKSALHPDFSAILASSNNHHFMKSESAAIEINRVLGWANCHGLPVAEDPELVAPVPGMDPEFDVAAIVGSPPEMDGRLERFLNDDDPDIGAIMSIVAGDVRSRLAALWAQDAPRSLIPGLTRFGEAWTAARAADMDRASIRHLLELEPDHRDAVKWLTAMPATYFAAIEHLWRLGNWQRTFVLRYLARYYRVGVFGSDWSSVGIGGGGWVDYADQAAAYARGRVAINISQAGEEEGVSHKPFQIAAAGVPMVHIRRRGLDELFEVGAEIEAFDTPRQARDTIAALLNDPKRRAAMAAAARSRMERDHTWSNRLTAMFDRAGISIGAFRAAMLRSTPSADAATI